MGIEMGTERSIRGDGVRELEKSYAVLGGKILYRQDGVWEEFDTLSGGLACIGWRFIGFVLDLIIERACFSCLYWGNKSR